MKKSLVILMMLLVVPVVALGFDHEHSVFTSVLDRHVKVLRGGLESTVDYAALKKNSEMLKTYLAGLSQVSQKEFASWTKEQRLAFLINAYNGFTIELILDNYPVKSIRKIGAILQSPWKIDFINLFNRKMYLDEIEHDLVRQKGVYDEPRIHFALVCASIGCPALQNRAFTAAKLEEMLETGLVRFLSDKTRNRYNHQKKSFEISKIFKWYGEDFNVRYGSVSELLKKYAGYLISNEEERTFAVKTEEIDFLDYDWDLNDVKGN